jgi:hypothetical protein
MLEILLQIGFIASVAYVIVRFAEHVLDVIYEEPEYNYAVLEEPAVREEVKLEVKPSLESRLSISSSFVKYVPLGVFLTVVALSSEVEYIRLPYSTSNAVLSRQVMSFAVCFLLLVYWTVVIVRVVLDVLNPKRCYAEVMKE